MTKNNRTIYFAINDSSSVNDNEFFWLQVLTTYEQLLEHYETDNIHIISFGDSTIRITPTQLDGMITRKRGHGNHHDLSSLARYIHQNDFHGDLLVLSDGGAINVENATDIMRKHGKMNTSYVNIIGGKPNSELFKPFTLFQGSIVQSTTSEGTVQILKTEEDDRSTFLGIEKMDVNEFLEKFDKIYNYITKPHLFGYANFGRTRTIYNNQQLRNILMKEKSRLIYEYAKMKKGDIEVRLVECIEKSDFEKAAGVMQELAENYYKSVNSETKELSIEEKIDKLIELCGNQNVNDYDDEEVRSNRAARGKKVKDADIDDLNEEEIDEGMTLGVKSLIQCPLSGEEDISVILVTEVDLLHGIAKNITNEIISTPFALVNYPLLKERVFQSLGGFVGLKSIKENKIRESPFNEKKIIGGIVLSNQKNCVEITKSIIAKMFCDGKLLGAAVSYLIALYECIKDDEEYEGCLLPFRNMICEMLKTSHSNAAMSGNVAQICTPLRADISYWFVAHSCLIPNLPPANSPFILHMNEMNTIFNVIEMLGYPIDERVKRHSTHFQIVQTLHRMKFINSDIANNLMRALTQKAIYIDKRNIREEVLKKEYYLPFIFVDGEADDQQKEKVLSLINPIFKEVSIEEIVSLNTFAHEKWRVNGTVLPIELPTITPMIETNWDGMKCGNDVCDIEKLKKKFVEKYKSQPQHVDEFILFVYRRLQKSTIPVFQM